MKRQLHVFRDAALDGPTNMARDEHLLYSETYRPAAVRIYAWRPPTISLGCFQRYAQLQELPAELRSLAVVRRPTGGGAILHDREVTYSLVLDDSLPIARQAPVALYRLAHELWRDALAHDGQLCEMAPDELPMPSPRNGPFFCFQEPGRTDLILGHHKLLGSAQRRVRGRVLQHGSLLLGRRFAAHPGADLGDPEPQRITGWIDAFLQGLARALALEPRRGQWTPDQLADVERRRQHYANDAWTCRR
jgi:lipoate-protein ligase A